MLRGCQVGLPQTNISPQLIVEHPTSPHNDSYSKNAMSPVPVRLRRPHILPRESVQSLHVLPLGLV